MIIFRRILIVILCGATLANAMQQQVQQHQAQQQQNQQPGHQEPDNDEKPTETDSQLAELNALMQNVIQNVINAHGSVDGLVKQKRVILCPICGKRDCGFSREETF